MRVFLKASYHGPFFYCYTSLGIRTVESAYLDHKRGQQEQPPGRLVGSIK